LKVLAESLVMFGDMNATVMEDFDGRHLVLKVPLCFCLLEKLESESEQTCGAYFLFMR
jgi:hypothetical protein